VPYLGVSKKDLHADAHFKKDDGNAEEMSDRF